MVDCLTALLTTALAAFPADPTTSASQEVGRLWVGDESVGRVVAVGTDRALAVWPRPVEPLSVEWEGGRVPAYWLAHDPFLGVGLLHVQAKLEPESPGGEAVARGQELWVGAKEWAAAALADESWRSPSPGPLGVLLAFDGTARITRVREGSAAARAGLAAGDLVRRIGDRETPDRQTVIDIVQAAQGGQALEWAVEGEGEERVIVVDVPYGTAQGPGFGTFRAFEFELESSTAGEPLPLGTPVRASDGSLIGVYWRRSGEGALALALSDWVGVREAIGRWPITRPEAAQRKPRVRLHDPRAFAGYTLYSPLDSYDLDLIDMDGRVVHRWSFDRPVWSAYFLENGDVLAATVEGSTTTFRGGGGQCGRIQRRSFAGELLWDYVLSDAHRLQHHDIEPLPNGNVLAIVWEARTREEALGAGRDPDKVGDAGMWPVTVVEVRPEGLHSGEIVWQWRSFDHLVQDRDPELPDYADPAENPNRIDINGGEQRALSAAEIRRLQQLGYIVDQPAGGPGGAGFGGGDWTHMNSIDYHPQLDQIVLSARHWSELWIIDHSTTTAEAATSAGGRSGKGGDLLYRWGNPQRYRRGTEAERQLFGQHDVQWIEPHLPGAGNLLIFNNGEGRRQHSSVDELVPPLDESERYSIAESEPFGPEAPVWSHELSIEDSSGFVSGAQRLPNGNTLICSGAKFAILEVTSAGDVVWDYRLESAGGDRPSGFGFRPPPRLPEPLVGDAVVDVPGPPGIFRATRIAADHPALRGRSLRPLDSE